MRGWSNGIGWILALSCLFLFMGSGCDRGETISRRPSFEPDGKFSIQATLSTNRVTIGDVLNLTVEIFHPIDSTLQELPVQSRGKAIEVSNRNWHSEPYNESLNYSQVVYEIGSWEIGEHVVATGQVFCVTSDHQELVKTFPELTLTVDSVLKEAQEPLRDIKPSILPKKESSYRFLIIFGVITLLALLLATLIARWVRPRKKTKKIIPPPPPHLTALEALEALRQEHLIEQGEHEPFYIKLSSIVRKYIEGRFHLDAPDMTTEEFIREASFSARLTEEHKELTVHFLEQSDLVKFARHKPDTATMETGFDSARRLVQESKPQEEPS
jgi:hypothetical protein